MKTDFEWIDFVDYLDNTNLESEELIEQIKAIIAYLIAIGALLASIGSLIIESFAV